MTRAWNINCFYRSHATLNCRCFHYYQCWSINIAHRTTIIPMEFNAINWCLYSSHWQPLSALLFHHCRPRPIWRSVVEAIKIRTKFPINAILQLCHYAFSLSNASQTKKRPFSQIRCRQSSRNWREQGIKVKKKLNHIELYKNKQPKSFTRWRGGTKAIVYCSIQLLYWANVIAVFIDLRWQPWCSVIAADEWKLYRCERIFPCWTR